MNFEALVCTSKLRRNKEASTVVGSVVRHLGSGDSTQEVERNTRQRLVFTPTPRLCYRHFLRALQQNRAQSMISIKNLQKVRGLT